MFQIIWIIIAGLIIGALARLVLRGRQDIPIWLTIVVGIVGALVGNFIASGLNVAHTSGVDWVRHILQVAVAVVALLVVVPLYHNARGGGRRGRTRRRVRR